MSDHYKQITREMIAGYVRKHPLATVREIQRALSLSSPSLVQYHLERLDTPRTICCPTCHGKGRVRPSSVPDDMVLA